jgi:hypothetical protein
LVALGTALTLGATVPIRNTRAVMAARYRVLVRLFAAVRIGNSIPSFVPVTQAAPVRRAFSDGKKEGEPKHRQANVRNKARLLISGTETGHHEIRSNDCPIGHPWIQIEMKSRERVRRERLLSRRRSRSDTLSCLRERPTGRLIERSSGSRNYYKSL